MVKYNNWADVYANNEIDEPLINTIGTGKFSDSVLCKWTMTLVSIIDVTDSFKNFEMLVSWLQNKMMMQDSEEF